MSLRDLFFRITAKDESKAAFKSVARNLRGTEGAVASLDERLGRIGGRLAGIGGAASVGLLPVGFALRDLITASGDFEAAMNRVGAVLDPAAGALAALTESARAAGQATGHSAIEAAEAIEMLAKNGLGAADILGGGLVSAMTLAAAGSADLASSADLVTDVMQNFGVAAGDLQTAADGVTGAMMESKFGFEDYALALGQAGGVAGAMGVSLADFNATLAATSTAFASGSDAGTSFKTFLQRLVPQSDAAAGAMDTLGLQFFDAQGNMRSMAVIAQELQDGLAGLSDAAKSDALTKIFGSDAVRTAVMLAKQGAAGIRDLHAAIGEASAVEQAGARMQGYNGALARLQSAWTNLGIAIGESGIIDGLTAFVQAIAAGVRWLGELSPGALKFGTILTGLAVVVAPVVAALGLLVGAVAVIGAPVAAAIAGVVALTAAVVAFWPEIKAMATATGEAVSAIGGWLGDKFSAIWNGAVETVGNAITAIGEWLSGKLGAVVSGAVELVGDVKSAFFDLWDAVVGHSYVPDMVDGISAEFARLPGVMVAPAEDATSATGGLFKGLADDVVGRIGKMRTEGLAAWDGFASSLIDRANGMVDKMVDQAFDRLANEAANSLSIFNGGAGGSGGQKGGAGGGIGSFVGSMFSGLGDLLGFHDGGSFTVGGKAGLDRNLVAFRAEPGERVTVDRPGEGAGRVPVTVNIYAQDVESFRRSTGQIASTIGRAVGRANRYA